MADHCKLFIDPCCCRQHPPAMILIYWTTWFLGVCFSRLRKKFQWQETEENVSFSFGLERNNTREDLHWRGLRRTHFPWWHDQMACVGRRYWKFRVLLTGVGPEGTPFAGGLFRTTIEFPENYPMAPPVVTFVSDFFHPNVYEDGKVNVSGQQLVIIAGLHQYFTSSWSWRTQSWWTPRGKMVG